MKFYKPNADFYVPDGIGEAAALARTTHIAICAHQDDIEIMAYHGVAECFGQDDVKSSVQRVTHQCLETGPEQ